MTGTTGDRDEGGSHGGDDVLYPEVKDPTDGGVSRRLLLRTSGVTGAAAASAGCVDTLTGGGDSGGGAPTIFVFNTGDKTVSLIDAAADELITTQYLGSTSSFPSNQYSPRLTDSTNAALWLNVSGGVKAVDPKTLETLTSFETGSDANWQELTPDGKHLVVSGREPVHKQSRLNADPSSSSFGEVTAELNRKSEGGRGDKEGPGPCDVTVSPDGMYAYVPDIFQDTLTVIDVEAFEIVTQQSVDPAGEASAVRPWMGTADWAGDLLLVENNEGDHGTESIWDVSDPTSPEELTRLTAADDLGTLPLTSEIGPDGKWAYVFTPGSKDVTVLDLADRSVANRIDVGGKAFVGTWGPSRETLYVPVQTSDEVAVIDHGSREVKTTISVGSKPYGATAGSVRPETDSNAQALAALASLGLSLPGEDTTYCLGSCHCGTMH